MKTTIYWFSGTGNSLAVARTIADRLDAELVHLVQTIGEERFHVDGAIGIVCPVYFYALPLIVREFLERLDASRVRHAFLVLTMGGFPGVAPLQARRLFRRAGKPLDNAFSILMPGNYIVEYNVRKPEAALRMARRGSKKAKRIAARIARRKRSPFIGYLLLGPLAWLLYATIGRRFARTCRTRDERFSVTAACTSCGTCVRVCSVGNVELDGARPSWKHACEQCFACLHLCPVEAIQIRGTRTYRRRRYHHPEVTINDLAGHAGGE